MANYWNSRDRQVFIDTLFIVAGDTGLEPVASCVLIKTSAYK